MILFNYLFKSNSKACMKNLEGFKVRKLLLKRNLKQFVILFQI